MKVPSSQCAWHPSFCAHLIRTWLGLSIVFAYTGVTPITSVRVSLAVVLNACLGLSALQTLNPRIRVSLTVFLGPSLILGGALSFVIFQAVGRGTAGIAGVASAGALAALSVVRKKLTSSQEDWTQRTFIGVLAVATLLVQYDFGNFVLPMFALVIAFFSTGKAGSNRTSRFVRIALLAISVVLLTWSALARNEYWWLITDDYKFFQVITQHIANHGVFEKWGVLDLRRYHWLSYGWSGILNEFAGSPAPLLTLTRVAPVIYCISISSSLLLIASIFAKSATVTLTCLGSALLVAALNPLDWSGTSTGAAYAVIAAACAVGTLSLHHKTSATRRLIGHFIYLPIAAATKLPSIIALLLGVLALELALILRRTWKSQAMYFGVLSLLCLLGTVSTVLLLRSFIPQFDLARTNPALGQISWFGPGFAAIAVLLNKAPIWSIAVMIFSSVLPYTWVHTTYETRRTLALACLAFVPVAVMLDVFITSNADNHRYFSGPVWFISSLAILGLSSSQRDTRQPEFHRPLLTVAVSVVMIGIACQYGAPWLWKSLEQVAPDGRKLQVVLLQFSTSDPRSGVSLVLISLFLIFRLLQRDRFAHFLVQYVSYIVIGILLLSAVILAPQSAPSQNRPPSTSDLNVYLGTPASRDVGEWLRRNTHPEDLIATNYLSDSDGALLDDFSMAMWSEREFLILGPRFSGSSPEALEAVRICEQYASDGTEQTALQLQRRGVEWFVVDTERTNQKSWSGSSDVGVRFGTFRILRLDS